MKRIGEDNQIHKQLSPEARTLMLNYSYPGNVRELENIVERVLILSPGEEICPDDLPSEVSHARDHGQDLDWEQGFDLRQRLRDLELEWIREALRRFGTQRKVAQHLRVSQSTIARGCKRKRIADQLAQN